MKPTRLWRRTHDPMAGIYGMITAMSDSRKDSEKTNPELTIHPAIDLSPGTKAKIAAEFGHGLSEAIEEAVRQHEDG